MASDTSHLGCPSLHGVLPMCPVYFVTYVPGLYHSWLGAMAYNENRVLTCRSEEAGRALASSGA